MTPAAARRLWKERIASSGETALLRRPSSTSPVTSRPIRVKVAGLSPEELVGGIDQRSRRVLLLAEDVEASGFPFPLRRNDKVLLRDKTLNVEDIDDDTIRIGNTLIAYDLRVLGSTGGGRGSTVSSSPPAGTLSATDRKDTAVVSGSVATAGALAGAEAAGRLPRVVLRRLAGLPLQGRRTPRPAQVAWPRAAHWLALRARTRRLLREA
jgi:hypothetical protein